MRLLRTGPHSGLFGYPGSDAEPGVSGQGGCHGIHAECRMTTRTVGVATVRAVLGWRQLGSDPPANRRPATLSDAGKDPTNGKARTRQTERQGPDKRKGKWYAHGN